MIKAMEDTLHTGEEINGRYVLKERKGRGTFGQVWSAYDRAADEVVAIKFYVALDHKGREEFIQEYRIAAKLYHPNLLVSKDYGEWHEQPYLTMKFCDRGSAADLVSKLNPCMEDEQTIWCFIRDVAAGLAYLHAVTPDPIVHQDIKPDNILVDSDGTFLITDFGISKRIRNTMLKQSERALKAGAPSYMGPERFTANPEPILASDVWSLGVSIYELAEGELPFSGMGGVMLLNGAEIPSLDSQWSKNLNDVMRWCLEKETWSRAKAFQVKEIADAILNAEHAVSVETLIAKMRNSEVPPVDKELKNEEPHKIDSHNDHGLNVVIPFWRKKPVVWAIPLFAFVIVVVAAIKLFPSPSAKPQPVLTEKEEPVVSPYNGYTPSQNSSAETSTDQSQEYNNPSTEQTHTASTVETVTNGTLDLGYATWQGDIKAGNPHGKGVMTFHSNHLIDSNDPNKRMAGAGDYIEGTYVNGHLDSGRWFKSDGSTEFIMLGE